MGREEACFDCLRRRISSDFSDKLVFCHGISDSPLPFSSSAVVHMSNYSREASEASASAVSQFILVYLQRHENDCLSQYIDECILQDDQPMNAVGVEDATLLSEVSDDEAMVGVGILSDTSSNSCSKSLSSSNGDVKASLDGMRYGSSTCKHSDRFSCSRTITALAPIAHVGVCSYSSFEELASNFLSGCLEDHILCSLNLLIDEKASGGDGVNFLHLLGIPSFEEKSIPGCLRHPNIVPLLGLLKSSDQIALMLPKAPYTLENILHYSPNTLKSEWHMWFLMYQLLSALVYLHNLGVSHGNVCPSSIMLTSTCWSWLDISDKPRLGYGLSPQISWCTEGCSFRAVYANLRLSSSLDWHSHFHRWWRGELSNFEYLLFLNRLAGRRWGDHTFHTVLPWVIDFSRKPDEASDLGWRDLSKSKWRLAKGDEQLDFTYSMSEIPHHVSDECLSELAVCSYKARRLPLSVLRMAVRSVYEPNEYPSTMQRLYQWTPDECIPEFYCDSQIFYSLHSGMTDLAVPSWASDPAEFIKLHRDALESRRVSSQIHHWIDITFGYKMSGQASVDAKNVMLPSSDPTKPRSFGRRQLFTQPHPVRRCATSKRANGANVSIGHLFQCHGVDNDKPLLPETAYLEELEETSNFSEHARHLSPCYYRQQDSQVKHMSPAEESESVSPKRSIFSKLDISRYYGWPCNIDLNYLLEHIEVENESSAGYQELLLWQQKSSYQRTSSEGAAEDIFSIGCVLAELYLRRPLFDSSSLARYLESGTLPGLMQELPSHAKVVVEACLEKDWRRRPTAKCLLESPYFSATVKSSYLFIAPLQLLASDASRLQYAANFAKGALKKIGSFAAEMCAPYCLTLIVNPLFGSEAEWAYILLEEFIKCLTPEAVKTLILPTIQKILQATDYSHLKVSLLQDSFVREIWNQIGKQAYLETIHPLVISNVHIFSNKSSASAAAVLLICSSEELGVPITVHQTVLPLIHCFGKGLSPDGIDVLVRIGGLLGEAFVVRQMLPLLKHVARYCVDISCKNKPEPIQSWSCLAVTDCLMTLDGLVAFLSQEVVVKELVEDQSCLNVLILMQKNLEVSVLQVAATALVAICQRIGPELTALHVLPQLKELFDEFAFSQEPATGSSSLNRNLKVSKLKVDAEFQIESRIDLVLILYPSFASLLGIEKLRQGCSTWLLLEQFLLRCYNWKWEYTGESSRSGAESIIPKRLALGKGSISEYSPAKLLLNGVGWSIPQSQGARGSRNLMPQRRFPEFQQSPVDRPEAISNLLNLEPWFWFPSPVASWDGPDFPGRLGGLKEEIPWKIRASAISSVRAHHGALRSLAVCQDESAVFTAGIGPGFKGTVQKWELMKISCVSGYYGHEEVVNDLCLLSSSGRIASCDGTVHVWNSRTGKVISVFAEPSVDSIHLASSISKINADQSNILNSNTLSGGILTSTFDGSLYTCMHYLEFLGMLVVGTGNGSLRFIDVAQGRKLHFWRGESNESAFPSLVSALCSCGSGNMQKDWILTSPSWVATGLSSGHCRLFDVRSGNVVSSWRAHDGYVTKLAALEDHLLVSSSLDRTLRIWDLRRNWPPHPTVFKGHTDGVSGFSLWGQDVVSISGKKIGLFSLSKSADEDGQHRVIPQKLYMSGNGTRNVSVLSSISILPFSRLFLVGTEDGYLRICC